MPRDYTLCRWDAHKKLSAALIRSINSSSIKCRCSLIKLTGKVKRFIKRHSMLSHCTGIVAAVSGGPDSIALLDILSRVIEPKTVASGKTDSVTGLPRSNSSTPEILVAHLDHGLRGAESRADAEFVGELAARIGLRFFLSSVDVALAARVARRSIEETAREMRYSFLLNTARENGCNRIATGHTMNDQAETVLLRLARGSGTAGLAGMRPLRPAHVFGSPGNAGPSFEPLPLVMRPLLCLRRDEVEEYCKGRGLAFRSDASNDSLAYTRNRVRKRVLPPLREINPRVIESICRTAELAAADQAALDEIAQSIVDASRDRPAPSGSDGRRYLVEKIMRNSEAVRRRAILEIIKRSGGKMSAITASHVS